MTAATCERELAPSPAAAAEARRWVDEVVAALGVQIDRDTARLLLCELVTNVVLHARTPMTLRAVTAAGVLRFEVHDDHPLLPAQRAPAEDAEGGFGLRLLSELATDWGAYRLVLRARTRKVVWFELPAVPVLSTVVLPGTTARC